MKKVQGFTLIELVIVIVILGILSAFALPRFIDVTSDARVASVNGMAGGLRSAMSLAKAQFMVDGTGAATVSMDGQTVGVTGAGYPQASATGIQVALQSIDGFTATPTAGPPAVMTFQPTNGGNATCQVTYTEPTAPATTPIVGVATGGC